MKNATDKLSRLPKSDGMTVPEAYFERFAAKTIASLPEKEIEAASERTFWHRVRPYVYLAAMFAGIWLMLKIFTLTSSTTPMSLDTDPVVAEALSNDDFVNEYVISDINQWDLYDDLMDDGLSPATLDSIAFIEMDVPLEYVN